MSNLSQIVNVLITRASAAVARQGFGIPMIFGTVGAGFTDSIRYYSDLESVGDDFEITDPVYLMAAALFSQSVAPELIAVGKRTGAGVGEDEIQTITPSAPPTKGKMKLKYGVNASAFIDFDDNAATITAAIEGITGIGAGNVVATGTLATSVVVTFGGTLAKKDVPMLTYSDNTLATADDTPVTLSIVETNKGVSSLAEELNALIDEPSGNDWYMLLMPSETDADILAAAAWTEAQDKFYLARSSDSDCPTSSTSDIAYQLEALGYTKTAIFYSSTITTGNHDACLAGLQLPKDAGSSTYANKQLVGCLPDALSATAIVNLKAKKANFYHTIAGLNVTQTGTTCSGEWIDVMIGIAYMKARIAENVFAVLAEEEKVPFTNDGIAQIANATEEALLDAKEKGILDSYVINIPKASDVSSADKLARQFKDLTFTGVLAGAIHFVEINGRVSV